MNVWNQVTLEMPNDHVKTDKVRAKQLITSFLDKYCDYQSIFIQADFRNRKQLFLAHLLNLYTISLISSKELLHFKLEMDQRLPEDLQ